MEAVANTTRRAGNLRLPGESRKRDSFLFSVSGPGVEHELRSFGIKMPPAGGRKERYDRYGNVSDNEGAGGDQKCEWNGRRAGDRHLSGRLPEINSLFQGSSGAGDRQGAEG